MEISKKDILKHYLSSILVYGIVLFLLAICPIFNHDIRNPYFNYITVLGVYYILYIIFAYPILAKFKPESILNSQSVSIINYFKKLFNKNTPLEERLREIEPQENEKQAFIILFIKAFFGAYCLSLLCNEFLPALDYDFHFLGAIFGQTLQDVQNSGFWNGILQFIDDSADMWLKIMITITTSVYAISYLTDTKFLGSKIKYADTTPLGILSCLACFYPFMLITNQLVPMTQDALIPVDNNVLRIVLYVLVTLVNFISMIAILRLGAKVGNLTNRGIVTGFPYNIVRHPDYSMQMCYVILTVIPVCVNVESILDKFIFAAGGILWLFIYYIRAITEERNLIKDEKYLEYTKKVKHRFIPGVI